MLDMGVVKSLKDRLALDQNLISIALLWLTIILGAALRFYDLGAESYWLDEVIMLRVAQRSPAAILRAAQHGRPPIYVLLAHFWMPVFGTTEAGTRSLSALAGVASMGLMYAVGRELFGRKVGLLSTLLMAISKFHIYYSQEFRYYSIFALLTLLSFLLYLRALKGDSLRHFVPYVLASILMFYSHTHGAFVLVAQSVYFLLQWNRYREARVPWLLCQTLILLGTAPGVLVALAGTLAGTFGPMQWIPDPPVWLPVITVLKYVSGGRPTWVTLLAGTAFLGIALLLFAVYEGKQKWLASLGDLPAAVRSLSSRTNELLLVSCWLLCPIVLPWVLSKVLGPMYLHRYTISAAPAFYLLVGLGIATVGEIVPEPISLGLLMILIAPGLRDYYVADVKEQWLEAAAFVEEHAATGDVIVLASGSSSAPFSWYYRGNLPLCTLDGQLTNDEAIEDAVSGCLGGGKRFWLILREEPTPNRRLPDSLLSRKHMRVITEKKLRRVLVYLFAVEEAMGLDRWDACDSERRVRTQAPPKPTVSECAVRADCAVSREIPPCYCSCLS